MPIKNRRLILLLILLFLLIIVGASKLPIAVERKITVFKPEVKKINGNDLLIDVNKNNCLPVDYVPDDLVNISDYEIPENSAFMLRKIVMQDLQEMVSQAKKEGIGLKVISAYRSYQKQGQIYNSWVAQLGIKEAQRQSAVPGCSQHQLGTAIDFNELNFSFADSLVGIWLYQNAWKYGWVISYPKNSEDITGYAYEPWHYRYIGKENAEEMQKQGLILSKFLEEKNKWK